MKITKDDWMKLASPVVLIVVGILLACSIIDSVGDALQLIVGIVLLIIGAIYMSLGFVKNKNVLDRYSIYGIGMAGLGVGLIVMNGVLNGMLSYLGISIGWALFIFGCLGFIFSIVYLCLHRSVKFYVTELVLSIICGVIGGLIIFPIGKGVIPANYLWLVNGIVIALIGLVWLVFTIMAYKQRNSTKKSYTKTVSAKKSK